jgi:hypothetical protein
MTFDRGQRRLLFEGLRSAFRSRNALQQLLSLEFDINLADIADQGTLKDVTFAVIDWFVGEGKVDELAEAAHVRKPHNPALLKAAIAILPPDQIHRPGTPPGEPGDGTSGVFQLDTVDEARRFFYDLEHRLRGQSQHADFERVRRIIEAILVELPSDDLPSPDEALDAALWLWDQLYEEERETVIQCLIWVNQSGGRERLLNRFRTDRIKDRRLLRDPRLKEIAPDLTQHWYNWPSVKPNRLDEHPSVKRWLDQYDFEANPFNPRAVERDLYLVTSWAFPAQWDLVTASRSSAIWSEVDYDRAAAALMLRHELQSAVPQTSFLVWRTLPLPNIPQEATFDDCLRAVARATADTWVRFLASNPWALLDLPRPDQMTLAELLLWLAVTRRDLHRRLDRAGLGESAQENALRQRLDASIGKKRYKGTPSLEELLSWLQIRPPGLEHTYFVVDCPAHRSWSGCGDQVTHLIVAASALIDAGVSLKICHAPLDIDLSRVDPVQLKWERHHLQHMLGRRIYLASKERLETFGELFGPEPFENADGLLIDHAHGSLGKMLELGDAVIREHIRGHDPADHYLEPSDLMAVLERGGSIA